MTQHTLTIEYLNEHGQLQKTEQFTGSGFTLQVQTGALRVVHGGDHVEDRVYGKSAAVADSHPAKSPLHATLNARPPWLGLPVWVWILLLGCVFSLVTFWSYWESHNPDQASKNYATTALAYVMGVVAWAAMWAFFGKVLAKRADFGLHLCVLLGVGIGVELLFRTAHFLAFSMSWYALGRIDNLFLMASACVLIGAHLRLIVEPARAAFPSWVVALLGLMLMSIVMFNNHQKRDSVLDSLHSHYLYRPSLQLKSPRLVDDFFGQAAQLEAVLKVKATEPEPGEDSVGNDADD